MKKNSNTTNTISWTYGIIAFAIGIVNSFWGNDPYFGMFIVLASFLYFPPTSNFINQKTGYTIPRFIKIALGIFIIWAALGVGELFDKIDLMINNL